MRSDRVILIVYTTKYRLGGAQFPVVANTLADEKRVEGFYGEIICRAVESKADVLREIAQIAAADKRIAELHLVGHSGM